MDFLKSMGAILLLVSGVLFGTQLNRSARGALAQIEGIERLLIFVRLQVECFSLPIGEILRRTEPSLLTQCGWKQREPPADLEALIRVCDISDPETERLLRELVSEFGRSYREEQLRRCDCYLRQLEARKERVRTALTGKKRVNLTLCAASAAALVILFV